MVDDDGDLSFTSIRIIVGNTPPVAVARADIGFVLTFENVIFNGTSSIDMDDNIATYSWDFGDGESLMGEVVVHKYIDDGAYVVTLTVTDTGGAYGTSSITIIVANRRPVAAFVDLEVMTGEPARFNGTMCSDMDGYIDSYRWDLGAGLIYTEVNASHTWDTPGVHVVTLTVWDDDGDYDDTVFNVTVLNQPPVAHVSASPVQTTLARPVTFNGSLSYDRDGEVTNWTWSFGDGGRDHGDVVEHAYTAYGTYLATLTVRDDSGGINTTSVLITVRNQPPEALFNVTPSSALTGEVITFNASNSTDPENQIGEYYWSFGDGDSFSGALATHSYVDNGRYTVRLTVVDKDGAASYVEFMVSIYNRPPMAVAEATRTEVLTFEDVIFKGSGSSDVDGTLLWYIWDLGDGAVGYGPTVTHSYSNNGIYTVALTVTDDDGSESEHTVEVTVLNRAPVSVAGDNLTTRTGVPLRLDGRSSYDIDGTIVLFSWDFGDGSRATGATVTHSFPSSSEFVVLLTVTDDDGATAISSMTVFVTNVQPVARVEGVTTVMSGEAMELDARSSYDLDGEIYDYQWDMGDGTTKAGALIKYTYAVVGTYTVKLTVEDDGQPPLSSSITFMVQVLNRRPTAVASASVNKLQTGDTLELDASGSSDPDGTVATYTWILGDGSVAYGAIFNHVYQDDGIYMVVLTVTDDSGGTDSTSLFIQVENRAPHPAMEAVEETLTLVSVEFTAEGTIDPDGRVVGFFWDFGDGSAADGWNVTHAYLSGGNYTIRLTVMDDDGRVAITGTIINVLTRAPTAIAEASASAYVNSTVKFDGSRSFDLDGIMYIWQWEFGDGASAEGREAYHRYTDDGVFNWNLTCIDDRGDTHSYSGNITIDLRPYVPGPPDVDDGQDGDDSPGPGAVMAVVAVALAAVSLVSRRRERQG